MKKKNITIFAFILTMMFAVCASCGDDNDSTSDGAPGTELPDTDPTVEEMSAGEAKSYFEETSRELAAKLDASEFNDFSKMWNIVADERNDGSNVEDWFEACLDACCMSTKNNTYKYLYRAANFRGEFTLVNGKWKKTGSSDKHLRFTFNDSERKPCVLTLTASDKGTVIHHEEFDDEDYYYDEYEINSFEIPEKIKLELTRSGSEKMTVDVNTSIKTSGEFDFEKDEAEVTVAARIADYSINVSKVAFKKGKEANAALAIMKGNETLITAVASGNGSMLSEIEDSSIGKLSATVDILGKVRATATIDNFDLFKSHLEKADENDENEKEFKRHINNANKCIKNANLYLKGSSNPSAQIYIGAVEEDYYGYKKWTCEPFLEFTDGSKISAGDYFDRKTFKSAINTLERFIDDLAEMFE